MTINGSCVFKQESRFSVWFLYRPYDVLSLCIVPYRPAQLFQRYKTAVKCGTATSHSLSLFSLLIDNNCSRNYYNYHRFVLSPFDSQIILIFWMCSDAGFHTIAAQGLTIQPAHVKDLQTLHCFNTGSENKIEEEEKKQWSSQKKERGVRATCRPFFSSALFCFSLPPPQLFTPPPSPLHEAGREWLTFFSTDISMVTLPQSLCSASIMSSHRLASTCPLLH